MAATGILSVSTTAAAAAAAASSSSSNLAFDPVTRSSSSSSSSSSASLSIARFSGGGVAGRRWRCGAVDRGNVPGDWRRKSVARKRGEVSRERFGTGVRARRPSARRWAPAAAAEVSTGGGDSGEGLGGKKGSGGGGGGGEGEYSSSDEEGGGEESRRQNRNAALAVLAAAGRSVQSLPEYLSAALNEGKIPPAVLERFLDVEKTPVRGWLMRFGGFRERLLADDLFLTKVCIECGVGLFTKTAAEYERRREKFVKELDFVVADVIMALIADFMLVWLPAPTVSLRPALAKTVGPVARFFANCPDNAFQVALKGTSYTTLQRLGAIGRNGVKLLGVGTGASLMGTAATNALIKLRQTVDKDSDGHSEDVPIFATSLAYGVYMAVSSNLRYQILAGVVEQRMLEPLLGRRKLALSACSFVARTGNTFLGSLLWVDYARFVGVQ